MCTWMSLKMLKTSKAWKFVPPKGLGGKDLQDWYTNEREYKYTMLGIITKEKRVEKKGK